LRNIRVFNNTLASNQEKAPQTEGSLLAKERIYPSLRHQFPQSSLVHQFLQSNLVRSRLV